MVRTADRDVDMTDDERMTDDDDDGMPVVAVAMRSEAEGRPPAPCRLLVYCRLGSEFVRMSKPDDIRDEAPPAAAAAAGTGVSDEGDGTATALDGVKENPPPTAAPRGEEGVTGINEEE
jgi:hypothetical protein